MDSPPQFIQKQYIVPKDKFSEYLIFSLAILIFVALWAGILYLARNYKQIDTKNTSVKSGTTSTKSGPGVTAASNLQGVYDYQLCLTGECPTNTYTGEKRCPYNPAQQMLYDPTYEVCNPANSCTNGQTPYAVLFDQSTAVNGVCDIDGCRCVNYLSTPSFTQVLFQVTGGDIYTSNPQLLDKWSFSQIPSSAVGQGNNVPIRYSDPQNQFYQISPSLLSNIAPLTQTCTNIYANGVEVSSRDIIDCVNSNPCVVGKMAYVLGYNQFFANFDYYNDAPRTPLACVPALIDQYSTRDTSNPYAPPACLAGYAPVFNYISGKIFCVPPPF